MQTRSRYLRRCAAALVAAAFVGAPAAHAARPDDRAGPRGAGAGTPTQLSTTLRPDDRAGNRGAGSFSAVTVHAGSSSFNWGDAGIGAAFTLTLALATGAMLVAFRRRGAPEAA